MKEKRKLRSEERKKDKEINGERHIMMNERDLENENVILRDDFIKRE